MTRRQHDRQRVVLFLLSVGILVLSVGVASGAAASSKKSPKPVHADEVTELSPTPVQQVSSSPPTGTIVINGGAAFTNNEQVVLTLTMIDQDRAGTGPGAQMAFSNDQVTYTPSEPYTKTKAWTLTPGEGLKTVWVKFRDVAGNWSSPVSDSITLDTVPPSGAITSPPDGTVLGAQ